MEANTCKNNNNYYYNLAGFSGIVLLCAWELPKTCWRHIYGTLTSQQSVSRTIRDVTAALNHPIVQSNWIKFPQTLQERDAIKRR